VSDFPLEGFSVFPLYTRDPNLYVHISVYVYLQVKKNTHWQQGIQDQTRRHTGYLKPENLFSVKTMKKYIW